METRQIDLTKMTEIELWKFVSEQQEQMTNFVIALNQTQQNINNAKIEIAKREQENETKP